MDVGINIISATRNRIHFRAHSAVVWFIYGNRKNGIDLTSFMPIFGTNRWGRNCKKFLSRLKKLLKFFFFTRFSQNNIFREGLPRIYLVEVYPTTVVNNNNFYRHSISINVFLVTRLLVRP